MGSPIKNGDIFLYSPRSSPIKTSKKNHKCKLSEVKISEHLKFEKRDEDIENIENRNIIQLESNSNILPDFNALKRKSFVSPPKKRQPMQKRFNTKGSDLKRNYVVKYSDDWTTKILEYKGQTFPLSLLAEQGMQHSVFKATRQESNEEHIVKLYEVVSPSQRQGVVEGDFNGYNIIADFLKTPEATELKLRLAVLKNDPIDDGFMFMEFIPTTATATYDWKGASQWEEISNENRTMLQELRAIFKILWQSRFDLGDFKPANVIWHDGKFVIIDYTWERSSSDFENNFIRYVTLWSKKSICVAEYLTQDLPADLRAEILNKLL